MEIKRDELFHFFRWINLLIGFYNLYLWNMGGGYFMLSLSALNLSMWVFTRKRKKNNFEKYLEDKINVEDRR